MKLNKFPIIIIKTILLTKTYYLNKFLKVEGADVQNELDIKVGENNKRTFVVIQGK